MPPTLVLDLDGTLVDSAPDLASALNRLMAARGLATFARPEVAAMIGDGARALVTRALAVRDAAFDEAALEAFMADYATNVAVDSAPFPGVPETLRQFVADGWRLAVCTNKPAAPSRALLEAIGLAPMMAAIGGGDSFPTRKPDPRHLLATLEAAGGTPDAAIMVGDHANDVGAATGAGLPCIFALWGYGPAAMAKGAAAVARNFSDLPEMAPALLAREASPA